MYVLATTPAPTSKISPFGAFSLAKNITAGIIGVNENDNLVMGGLVEESHQIFRNLKKILDIYEINFSNIFKCTVFILSLIHI